MKVLIRVDLTERLGFIYIQLLTGATNSTKLALICLFSNQLDDESDLKSGKNTLIPIRQI